MHVSNIQVVPRFRRACVRHAMWVLLQGAGCECRHLPHCGVFANNNRPVQNSACYKLAAEFWAPSRGHRGISAWDWVS